MSKKENMDHLYRCNMELISISEMTIENELQNLYEIRLKDRQVKSKASYSQFSIPPIYRDSINRLQLPILEASKSAITQSGILEEQNSHIRDNTDVIFCSCLGMDRAFKNFQRIYSKQLINLACNQSSSIINKSSINKICEAINDQLGSSSHDKVGEMASTIPARVAAQFGLKGRAYVLESRDETFIDALAQANDALKLSKAKAVLIISAQSIDATASARFIEGEISTDNKSYKGFTGTAVEGVTACIVTLPGTVDSEKGIKLIVTSIGKLPTDKDAELISENINTETFGACSQFGSSQQSHIAEEIKRKIVSETSGKTEEEYGYSYVNAPAKALIELVGQINHQPTKGLVCGRSTLNNECFITLEVSENSVEYTTSVPDCDIGICAASADFGDLLGNDGYWSNLTNDVGSIKEVGHNYSSRIFSQKYSTPNDSYYNCTASYNPDKVPEYASDLMEHAAQCLSNLQIDEYLLESDRLLTVTATCLTGINEKKLVFSEYLPTLKAITVDTLLKEGYEESVVLNIVEKVCQLETHDTIDAPTLGSDLSTLTFAQRHNQGDAVAVEGACAGSLVALDIAINALANGRYDCAIVMGIEHPVNINDLTLCSSQRMLAEEIIATFTEVATGFTSGNGAGAVILKRESDLQRKPPVSIKSIGASTWSKSVIAPNKEGQIKAMKSALEKHKNLIEKVHFIETHGTGTTVGDVVEVESIQDVYDSESRSQPIYLGALKTRFGHTFAAAGMASIIKIFLIAKHGKLPRNLIRGPIRKELQLEKRQLDILEHDIELNSGEHYITAINAFGTGGINFHALTEINVQ